MHEFKEPQEQNLEKKYISIIEQIRSLISDEEDIVAILSNVSAALHQTFKWLWAVSYTHLRTHET